VTENRVPAIKRDPRFAYVWRISDLLQVATRPQAPPGPIIVKSVWGLANRIYGLLNAVAYAARFGRPLHVDWTDGMYAEKGTNAFPGVFSLHGIESLDGMPRVDRPFPDLCRGRLDEDCRTTWAPRTESIFKGFPDFDQWHLVPRGVYDGYVYCSRPSYGRPFALAARLPFQARSVYERHVAFSDSMQRQLAAHAVRTDHSWIGVHYRCTDLKTDCPLERIAEIVEQSGCRKLYWATDHAESGDVMRRLLPSHHIETTMPVDGLASSGQAIHTSLAAGQHERHLVSACADLRSLSGCGVIVRKPQSTFGRLAAEVLSPVAPRQIFIV
jgi:hypothetical protein